MPGLNIYQSVDTLIEVQDPEDSEWVEIAGANSYTESGGEAPVTSVSAFRGSSNIVGSPTAPTAEIGISAASPLHRSSKLLRSAYTSGELRSFRVTLDGDTVLATTSSGNTAAIDSSDGSVTLVGTPANFSADQYAIGMDIVIGSNSYNIVEIDDDGDASVHPEPSSNVAAGVYSVVRPKIRRTFTARVSNADRSTLAGDGNLEGTISLAIEGQPGEWARTS